ncbi:MAG: iron uptake transporter permease EfeU [Anaerolineae bacterium]
MIASLLIAFREGIEASLIVGIVMGYLRKTGQTRYNRYAWAGVVAAVLLSIVVAVVITAVGVELEGTAEQIFEGVMMFIAVAMLTWMVFWMRFHSRTIKSSLEGALGAALRQGHPRSLFVTTFVAVLREGIETALFISALAFGTDTSGTLLGAVLGLAVAAVVGYLIYVSTVRLNLSQFFNVTSILLLVVAAGLFARGIHEFQEAHLLPTINEHVWDINHVLSEDSTVGEVLKALVGYSASPSAEQVAGYVGYLLFAVFAMPRLVTRQVDRSTQRAALAHSHGAGD